MQPAKNLAYFVVFAALIAKLEPIYTVLGAFPLDSRKKIDNEGLAAVEVQLEVPLRKGTLGAPPVSECRRRVSEAVILGHVTV